MMKKSLLLIAALAATAGVNAQRLETAVNLSTAPRTVEVAQAQMATSAQRAEMSRIRKAESVPSAWYYRPQGTFFAGPTPGGALYYAPQMIIPVSRENTIVNASENAENSTWWYSYYNNHAVDSVSMVAQDLTWTWGWEQVYAPTVIASNKLGTEAYQLYNDYYNSTTKESTIYKGYVSSVYEAADIFGGTQFVSPVFWAAGMRNRSTQMFSTYGGWITLTGAKACDNQTDGYWFGRNAGGWNAMAVYVEAPIHKYALRQIGIVADFSLANEDAVVELPVEVHAVELVKTEEGADSLQLGDILAAGVAVIDKTTNPDDMLVVPLMQEDEDGIESEIVLEVDQAIAVVVKGYDNDNLKDFYMYISTDGNDDGYGQHGYMLHADDNGDVINCYGLDNFFTVSLGNTAPSILLDVEYPLIEFNFDEETGEYKFPNEGGKVLRDYTVSGTTYTDQEGIWFVSRNHASDEFAMDSVPEWLTIQLADGTNEEGEYNGLVIADVTCQALPEGVTYREAKVRFHYAGAEIFYTFTQGEKSEPQPFKKGDVNGDGKVDVDDINILINIVLGKDEAANYEGRANVDGQGSVDVQDINMLINIMLGKAEE